MLTPLYSIFLVGPLAGATEGIASRVSGAARVATNWRGEEAPYRSLPPRLPPAIGVILRTNEISFPFTRPSKTIRRSASGLRMVNEIVVSVAFPPAMLTVFVCWLTNPVSADPSLLSAKIQGAFGTEFAIHRPDTPVGSRIASGITGRVAAALAAPRIAVNCLAPFTPRIPL